MFRLFSCERYNVGPLSMLFSVTVGEMCENYQLPIVIYEYNTPQKISYKL